MRGRKPSVLSLAPSDEDRLHTTADSDSLPWYQVRRVRILWLSLPVAKRDVAAQMECGVATVWRACERYRRDGLEGLLADGREGRSGRLEDYTCERRQSWNWPVWNQLPRPAHHPLVQPGPGSSSRGGRHRWLDPGPTVRRLWHDVDLQPHRTRYWKTARRMPGSKSERSKSFGAMGMRSDWLNKASGSFVSMRSRPERKFAGASTCFSNRVD